MLRLGSMGVAQNTFKFIQTAPKDLRKVKGLKEKDRQAHAYDLTLLVYSLFALR